MASKKDKIDKYTRGMFIRQDEYALRVKKHYDKAVDRLLELARKVNDKLDDEPFIFSEHLGIRQEATDIIRQLYTQVYREIRSGVEAEWEYANLSCDAMITDVFGRKCKEMDVFARMFERNRQSMDQFFMRIAMNGGMNLSQKVWKYTGSLRSEMENAITVSLGEGVSAATMSRRVRQYLQEPERLFRRVRGADKKLHLSKAAKAYHPGQGVYRSSYKNAMRLTRTETNAAYRLATEERWQRMDFVVGMRVHRSNNHPVEDICDELAGDYPKDFKFSAWHPQCRCYVTSILCTPEEMIRMQKNILAGKSNEGFRSVNQVDDVPKAFKDWVENNQNRIAKAKALPYFLRDNGKVVDGKWVYGRNVNLIKQGSAPSFVQEAKIKYGKAIGVYGSNKSTYNNEIKIEGVIKRDVMTHEEADGMRANPQWKQIGGTTNCQASVVAYALRREGYLIRANVNDGGCLFTALEKNPEKAWIDKRTGEPPKTITAGGRVVGEDRKMRIKSRSEMSSEFSSITAEEGLYQIMIGWKRSPGMYGHTLVVERLNNGKLMVFDPQRGTHYKWRDYIKEISPVNGIEILPLKGLTFNEDYNQVLKLANI